MTTATGTTITGITTPIPMVDLAAQIRLLSWLSPAFPIGGFAYSQGFETAIAKGAITTIEDVAHWVEGLLHAGPIKADATALSLSAHAVLQDDPKAFAAIAELVLALQVSSERDKETREQAQSFLISARAWPVAMPGWLTEALARPIALPVAFGGLAGVHGIDPLLACAGYINAFVSQQISVAIRLVPLGQSDGLALLARLEPQIAALAQNARQAGIDDIGTIGYGADIASLTHEDLSVRIFRS